MIYNIPLALEKEIGKIVILKKHAETLRSIVKTTYWRLLWRNESLDQEDYHFFHCCVVYTEDLMPNFFKCIY